MVEVVVSAALIFTAVVALLSLATTSLKGTGFSTNKSKATKLANEEMELIRSYRDSAYWSTFKNGIIDPDSGNLCTGTDCYIEVSDGGNALSMTTDGPEAEGNFSRHFTAAELASDRLQITVHVRWDSRGETQEVTISSVFTDWQ